MLTIPVYNLEGEETGKIKLPEEIFGLEVNKNLISQTVNVLMANKRNPWAHTKDRSEVRGGGVKPWKQKGTGRARHGSIRSPLWRGGGVTFGPRKEKVFKRKINKKAKTKVLFMILSSKLRDKELLIVENLEIKKPKTKLMSGALSKILKDRKKDILMATSKKDKDIIRASKNIPYVKTIAADSLNILDLLSFKYLLLDKEGIEQIKKTNLE
jgi:large subunit ribosomal protein L4